MKIKQDMTVAPVSTRRAAPAPAGRRTSSTDRSAEGVAREIEREVSVFASPSEGFNGVANIGSPSLKANFVNLTLDNSGGGADALFIIGDPTGTIEAVSKLTLSDAVPSSGATAGFKEMCREGYVINRILYQTSSDPAQFGKDVLEAYADVNGAYATMPVNIFGAKRPNNEDPNLLVLDFPGGMVLNTKKAIIWTVAAGETVTLSVGFAAAG